MEKGGDSWGLGDVSVAFVVCMSIPANEQMVNGYGQFDWRNGGD